MSRIVDEDIVIPDLQGHVDSGEGPEQAGQLRLLLGAAGHGAQHLHQRRPRPRTQRSLHPGRGGIGEPPDVVIVPRKIQGTFTKGLRII